VDFFFSYRSKESIPKEIVNEVKVNHFPIKEEMNRFKKSEVTAHQGSVAGFDRLVKEELSP
jgi:hypothetical protein